MIPEMSALSDGAFTFQQDGARSHTSAFSLNYFEENLPDNAELLKPDFWPPNSPDLNLMDYAIWSMLDKFVFSVKIRDLDHLQERLGERWDAIGQDAINRTISSFRKRVQACLDAEGNRFEYKL